MILLALDIATKTGWARGPIDGHRIVSPIEAAAGVRTPQPESGTRRFAGTLGEGLDAFANWLWGMTQGVHRLAYEAPILPATTNIDTVRRLNGLAGIAEMVAHKRGLPVPLVVQNATIKKHWTGSGRARKPDMVYLATQRGWRAQDDNEADALALWDYTAGQIAAGLWTPAVRRKGAA